MMLYSTIVGEFYFPINAYHDSRVLKTNKLMHNAGAFVQDANHRSVSIGFIDPEEAAA